jgi:hypothetical protein
MIPQYLATLIQATIQIRPELVSNCRFISDIRDLVYLEERSFAYELYRQWEDLVEDNYEDMVVNAEVRKKYQKVTFIRRLIEIFGLTKKGKPHISFYPDIVFHHSQFDSVKQEIICEIKTKEGIDDNKNVKLNQDLKKLAAYMTDNTLLYHPFKTGVFILVGGALSEIKNRYIQNSLVDNKVNDIYCLSYNVKRLSETCYIPDVICMSLNEVLQLNKKMI